MAVDCDPLIREMLRDESLTRGLGDIEARMLVEWLADWTELFANASRNDLDARKLAGKLLRRGKAIGRFVQLWCKPDGQMAASQLFAAERFAWPLPTRRMKPPDLMHQILAWENQHPQD